MLSQGQRDFALKRARRLEDAIATIRVTLESERGLFGGVPHDRVDRLLQNLAVLAEGVTSALKRDIVAEIEAAKPSP